MTSTDEILAVAASAVAAGTAPQGTASSFPGSTVEVTQADIAAFRQAAARGADSEVVRALRAVRPPQPSVDPAWTAWLTAAAVTAAAGQPAGHEDQPRTTPAHPAWLAVFAAGTALWRTGRSGSAAVTAPVAIAAGMSAAAITETGLSNWGGWSSGCVAAVIGAGVTSGLLLGLDLSQTRSAIGICATQAAGLAAAEVTHAFALQVGKAAFNGVEAAFLAQAGFTAPAEPLDGRRGLFALFG